MADRELREAAEAVIAFVPLHTGEPMTGWQRNSKERRQAAIARLRALIEGSDPASPEPALDVKRLARALHDATSHYQGTVNPETEAHRVQHEYDARAVIAAYEADGRG